MLSTAQIDAEQGELHAQREQVLVDTLLRAGARSVLDLGCGDGALLASLAKRGAFERLTGVERSLEALCAAERRLRANGALHRGGISLHHASFEAPDRNLAGHDAAVMLETIEHVDPRRLSCVEHAVFAIYRPGMVLITTPNREYNPLYGMAEDAFRHPEHRFEWTRGKFRSWATRAAARHGYGVGFRGIGPADLVCGSPTQMATFTLGA
jgi:small RNA 2'-O-methyltransferase